jgi:hypothetical protein
MSYEHLLMHSVVAGIKVTAQSADRIADFLPQLLAPRDDFPFKIGERTFKIGANPERSVELDESGNWAGTIVIKNNSDPSDVSRIVCRLKRKDPNGDARLVVTFNPSWLLASADIVPTLPDGKDPMHDSPASSKLVNALLLGIGFDVLNNVYWHTRNDPNLIESADDGCYHDRHIQLQRVDWDMLLPCPDPREFLSYLVLIFEPTFKSNDGRLFRLSSLLKMQTSYRVDDKTGTIRTVTFTRLQGQRRKLFSIEFSVLESGVPKDVDFTDSLNAAAGGRDCVRMRVTAYPDGIDQLIREGLPVDNGDDEDTVDPGFDADGEQRGSPIKRNIKDLSEAIAHLAEKEKGLGHNQGSFPRWLARKILRDTLNLDVIGGFTQKDVEAVAADKNQVTQAWAKGGVEPMDTNALASEAKVSDEAARKYRSRIRAERKIDIGIPLAFYNRASLAAIREMDDDIISKIVAAIHADATSGDDQLREVAIKSLSAAARRFADGRRDVIGGAINRSLKGELGVFRVEVVSTKVKALTRIERGVRDQSRVAKPAGRKRLSLKPAKTTRQRGPTKQGLAAKAGAASKSLRASKQSKPGAKGGKPTLAKAPPASRRYLPPVAEKGSKRFGAPISKRRPKR